MSIESAYPSGTLPSSPQSWSEVWLRALTQPSVATYEEFVSRPDVSARRAYAWVFVSSLIASGLAVLGFSLLGGLSALGAEQGLDLTGNLGTLILALICIGPITGLFSIIGLVITVGIKQWVARALGGTGSYLELSYAIAAYLAPLSIITGLLGIVPLLNCLNLPLGIYGFFLNVLAIKSVHRFGWGRAFLSSAVIVISILLVIVAVVVLTLILILRGPAIGDSF